MNKRRKYALLVLIGSLFSVTSFAQFYNGLQMTFGKNRVQYNNFYWQYYRFDKFDTYFNQYGQNLALYTQWYADQEIKRVENLMDYSLEKRIIFLIYNKLTDFRQSNIGLVNGNEDYNTGGVTRIINNKVFLYFEGDHQKFQRQITSSIAEVTFNEMLYGDQLRENVANSTLISLPDWFTRGLVSYISENWSVETEDRVKDGVISGRFRKINRLTGDEAVYAGHSFWRFIEKTYGKSVIPNIIYITRVNKNAKQGFLYVLGSSLKEISKEWWAYYQDKYKSYAKDTTDPGNTMLKRPKKTRVYQHIKISSDGRHFAYVTNEQGQYRLWLYDEKTGKKKCLLKREHKLDQIADYSFPVLAWHPSGHILTFLSEEKGGLKLSHYDIATKELVSRNFLYLEKVLDFSYSDDGSRLVMSAMRNGKTDIYVHTLASATNEQITDDIADDIFPKFTDHSKRIIFSSNRTSDTLIAGSSEITQLSPEYKLYTCSYPHVGTKLIKISTDEPANHTQAYEIAKNRFAYLNDANGIVNRYIADYDSSISFVDTTIHYRYTTRSYPVTDYPRNILEQDINQPGNQLAQLFFKNNKYRLYKQEVTTSPLVSDLKITDFRNEQLKNIRKADSLAIAAKQKSLIKPLPQVPVKTALPGDSGITKAPDIIDINHYVFEIEKQGKATTGTKNVTSQHTTGNDSLDNELKIRIYQTAFYANLLVSQVDFTFLNSTYQTFSGGGSYYEPGFNALIKIGTTDLFEDYKITGGFRLSLDFQSNEYLLSFENLKKRLDKQLVFHRQAYKNTVPATTDPNSSDYYLTKTVTTDGYYILKYPFSQVMALRLTTSLRHDRIAYLFDNFNSSGLDILQKRNTVNLWGGLKMELIFDNSRPLGINVYSGTRYKIFGEAYKQLNRGRSDLFVLGADFRHYEVIHRNLIWASRVAGSTSFGGSRLIYYLGSVDNWVNLSTKVPTFDNSIPIDNNGKYAYQTLATNMRGFVQNARNGNNFTVINNEIRWPFIKYFANYPISSNFWSSLQAIGFFDIGSAWTGLTPFSGKNAYDRNVISNGTNGQGNVTVYLDSGRSPVLYGYGFGFRAQLLGYFMRFDWAWGIENKVILPGIFYLSLNLDF